MAVREVSLLWLRASSVKEEEVATVPRFFQNLNYTVKSGESKIGAKVSLKDVVAKTPKRV